MFRSWFHLLSDVDLEKTFSFPYEVKRAGCLTFIFCFLWTLDFSKSCFCWSILPLAMKRLKSADFTPRHPCLLSKPSGSVLQESEVDSNKQSDSPSEEEPSTPRATIVTQNPKYQLLMNHELKTNGLSSREPNGPGGGGSVGDKSPRLPRWETTRVGTNNFRGSLESLASRDWDTGSDRVGEEDLALSVCVCVRDSALAD